MRALKVGDLLCAVPAFRAFRAAWPRAEIVLVGLPWARTFVERFDAYLDGFREFPGYPGLPEREPRIARIPEFLRAMQAEAFDLAIQLHGSGPIVNPLVAQFGARRAVGFYLTRDDCPDAESFLPWPNQGLEVRRLLRLVEFLGLPVPGEHLEFPVRADDCRALRAIPGTTDLQPGEYVCIHPGASVPERRWPPERFAAVARALAARGFKIVLTGSAEDAPLTQIVSRSLRTPSLDLAARTDLGALAALLEGARLVVCNDTSVSHLAAALRVPSVVLSTGDNPLRWAPADRARHRVLCGDADVEPADVIAEAVGLMHETDASGRRVAAMTA